MEVYYYDGNLNHACSIGGQTLASEPMDFEKVFRHYDVLKIYALSARTLCKETVEDRNNLVFEHLKLGRHFLENPDEVNHDQFVQYLVKENQKAVVRVNT